MKKLYHYTPLVILSVFTAIFICLAQAAAFAENVLLDPKIYKDAMDQREVSKAMYEELVKYFDSLSAATGIPVNVFTDPIKEEDLYAASFKMLDDSIKYISDSQAPKPSNSYDFTALEKSITDYIEKDAEERSIEKDKEYQELLDNTIKMAKVQVSSRLDTMMLFSFSDSSVAKTLHNHSGLITVAFWGFVGLAVLMIVIMVIIDRHHPRDLIYWAGLLMAVSAAVFLIPCVYLYKTEYFSSFFITNTYIHKTVTGMLELSLKKIILVQNIVLVIGLVLLVAAQVVHVLYKNYCKKQWKKTHWHKDVEQEPDTETPEADEASGEEA